MATKTTKKPAVKKAKKTAEKRLFKVEHTNGPDDYFLATSDKNAGEIEKRLSLLVRMGKIRRFTRHAKPIDLGEGFRKYDVRVPDQIMKV